MKSDRRNILEEVLGQRPEKRTVPGVKELEGTAVFYLKVPAEFSSKKLFRQATSMKSPPYPKSGGVVEGGCTITPPSGASYVAVKMRGDIDGWRSVLEKGVSDTGSALARVSEKHFHLEDGTIVPLDECKVTFSSDLAV